MAGDKLIFKDAELAKQSIMDSQKKEIAELYNKWADEISDKAHYYSLKTTASAPLANRQLLQLQKQLKETSQVVSNEVYNKIKSNMYTVADSVVQCNTKWMESLGFDGSLVSAAFTSVPDSVVRNIVTGQIYDSGWSLSKRIWSDNEDTLKDIYEVVAKGVAQNTPIYEIAKNLEAYVKPDARLPWNLTVGDGVKIFKKQVDYNAQRLARTLVQHSYQQSFIATTQKNPFITDYIWHSNGSRVCPLCAARDGEHYKKDELPMDHPNGMCVMEPNVVDNLTDQLADWFNAEDGTYPEIDEFASNFGYAADKGTAFSLESFKDKFGNVTNQSALQVFKSNLNNDAYGEWFSLQKQVKKDMGYTVSSGKDFWADYSSGKIKSKEMDVFLNKNLFGDKKMSVADFITKYGKSTKKSDGSWYKGLSAEAKEAAKELKNKSGLTWPEWYKQNIYDGDISKLSTVKKVAKKEINNAHKNDKVIKGAIDNLDGFNSKAWMDSLHKNNLSKMDNWMEDWLADISLSEKRAVQTYTGNAYWDMNGYLRGQRSSTEYKQAIKDCQSALSKASLSEETIVRRGSDYNMLLDLDFDTVAKGVTKENKAQFIGGIVEDKGFMSTSPAPNGGFDEDIEYVIKLPKGSQAMYVDSISKHSGEKELLINCGSKYTIEDVEVNKYGEVKKIYMTLINLH